MKMSFSGWLIVPRTWFSLSSVTRFLNEIFNQPTILYRKWASFAVAVSWEQLLLAGIRKRCVVSEDRVMRGCKNGWQQREGAPLFWMAPETLNESGGQVQGHAIGTVPRTTRAARTVSWNSQPPISTVNSLKGVEYVLLALELVGTFEQVQKHD